MKLEIINPANLGAPRGYSQGVLAPANGRILFVAGQIAWNKEQQIVSADFVEQFQQALTNVIEIVHAAGGQASHIARMSIYVSDCGEYNARLKAIGSVYRILMGNHYPAMTLFEVQKLLEAGAKLEIEATAVVP